MARAYRTAITTHVDGGLYVYGHNLVDLAGNTSFAKAIFLILKGEMPDKSSEKMFEAILTVAIDHGVEPASVVAARNIYSGGSPVQAAVAGGILALGEFHGGAIEAAMENFKKYESVGVKRLVEDFAKSGTRVAGFGHRLYDTDPRTQRLLEVAKQNGFFGKYVKFALLCEGEISKGGKKLPLNIDGIVAALLLEMDFNPKVGKGVFIIARTPGLVAHVVEEALREKPVRRLLEKDVEYDGPRPRK
ncbi:MAG: citryl-CoA lyase [Candidatus Curtissbacteria bacterium]|nr:citryl-CoA lyase [Candidatus Curtissbacteria bacterium]MDZ4209623.1 citryl-CoA lyase [Candidatus Curtissbacteria bacterium]